MLGAGFGTRLRPLTDSIPKPLVPIFNKPLISFAFDHLIVAGVERLVVNTHHKPEAYTRFPGEKNGRAEYRAKEVLFRHEAVLLETGGGIKNAADLLGDEPFLVYNGDVLADFPLERLIDAHRCSGNIATLALRSTGAERRIRFDPQSGLITDIRELIGGRNEPEFLFTGASVISPEVCHHIKSGEVISIIPVLVDLMKSGARVGGVVVDEGVWFDIGNIDAYVAVHKTLASRRHIFSYLPPEWMVPIDPSASIDKAANILGATVIGKGATVGFGAFLENAIVWPGEHVAPGAKVVDAVVANGQISQASTGRD